MRWNGKGTCEQYISMILFSRRLKIISRNINNLYFILKKKRKLKTTKLGVIYTKLTTKGISGLLMGEGEMFTSSTWEKTED